VPFQRLLAGLLFSALGLPILLCVVFAVAKLLEGMQDAVGAVALERVALGLFILWIADLIGLVIVLAIHSLGGTRRPPDDVE
jgi:hypothetical protein